MQRVCAVGLRPRVRKSKDPLAQLGERCRRRGRQPVHLRLIRSFETDRLCCPIFGPDQRSCRPGEYAFLHDRTQHRTPSSFSKTDLGGRPRPSMLQRPGHAQARSRQFSTYRVPAPKPFQTNAPNDLSVVAWSRPVASARAVAAPPAFVAAPSTAVAAPPAAVPALLRALAVSPIAVPAPQTADFHPQQQ